jgi:hypothetical protein
MAQTPPRQDRVSIRTRFLGLIAKTGRVLLLLAALHGIVFLVSARSVKADVEQMLMGLGAEMMRYGQATRQDAPRTLTLNGQALKLSVGSTENSLGEVLDHYEGRCISRDGGLSQQQADAYRKSSFRLTDRQERLLDTTLRQDADDQGFVACLDAGTDQIGWKHWAERLSRFVKTGNVSEVGQLRYVYAHRGKHSTTFVTLWPEGALNVWEMFPNAGDAPGFDLPNVPRPNGSRRLLSARESGFAQSVNVYGVRALSGEQILKFYRNELPKQGWHLTEDPQMQSRPKHAPRVLLAERDRRMLTIITGTDRTGGGFVNVLNMN